MLRLATTYPFGLSTTEATVSLLPGAHSRDYLCPSRGPS
jgi:hypothetical protein